MPDCLSVSDCSSVLDLSVSDCLSVLHRSVSGSRPVSDCPPVSDRLHSVPDLGSFSDRKHIAAAWIFQSKAFL